MTITAERFAALVAQQDASEAAAALAADPAPSTAAAADGQTWASEVATWAQIEALMQANAAALVGVPVVSQGPTYSTLPEVLGFIEGVLAVRRALGWARARSCAARR